MVSLTTFARSAGARMSERVTAAVWGQTRRFFRMQSRLRSNEPTQIFVCAVTGSARGRAGRRPALRWSISCIRWALRSSGDHSLSTGIGVDPMRIMIVPAVGGLVLGLGALVMRRFRSNEVVDPIEANALHGGRMSMLDSLRLVVATVVSNASGVAVGMEAGYAQLGSGVFSKVGQYFRLRRSDLRIFVARRRRRRHRRGLQRAAGRRLLRLRADPGQLCGAAAGAGGRPRRSPPRSPCARSWTRRRCSASASSIISANGSTCCSRCSASWPRASACWRCRR